MAIQLDLSSLENALQRLATRTAKPYSDLDLAIIGESALPLSLMAAMEHDFTESDLPFKVDLVDWASTSPAFRAIIESHRVVLR